MSHSKAAINQSTGSALGEPLVEYVCRQLKEQIGAGYYRIGECIPSIRDLSSQLDISRDTIRRAAVQLVRDGVLENDQGRRFRVSGSLRDSWLRTMRLVFTAPGRDHIANGVFQVVYDTIRREAEAARIEVKLKLMMPDEKAVARDFEGADVILAAGYTAKGIAAVDPGAPVVGINTLPCGGLARSIHTDYFAGGQIAANHLYALGYRKVAIVSTDAKDGEVFELRNIGFRKAWIDGGGKLRELHDLKVSDRNQANLVERLREYTQANPDVEAYFCVRDDLALVVCDVLESLGRAVPDDVGIIGFDGSHEALLHLPPLTTIRQEMDELATIALRQCRLLFNGYTSGDPEIALVPQLVPGGSVKKFKPN